MRYRIPFLPPSLNQIYHPTVGKDGKLKIYKSEEAKRFKKDASFFLPKHLVKGKVAVYIRFFIAEKPEKKDLDNLLKLTLDAIEGRLIENDNQVWELTCHKYEVEEKKEEGVEIEVIPLNSS